MARIQRDKSAVQNVLELLQTCWTDPFAEHKADLASLSSGKAAPAKVANDLLNAYEYGEAAYQKFKNDRLETVDVSNKPLFHDPLPRLRLQTFVNDVGSKAVKSRDRTIIVKNDKNIFRKMILICQTRNLQMSDVLSHPFGPIAYELATPDSSIRKNNKSSLGKEVLKKAALATLNLSRQPSAYIVDGMAMVHRLPPNLATFGDAADALRRMILTVAISMLCLMCIEKFRSKAQKGNGMVRLQTVKSSTSEPVEKYSSGSS